MKLNPPEGFEIFEWLKHGTGGKNPHTYEYVDPIVEKAIKYLKDQGFSKIGSVGYCFVSVAMYMSSKLLTAVGRKVCCPLPCLWEGD